VPSAIGAGLVKGLGAEPLGVTLPDPGPWLPLPTATIDGRPVPAVNVPATASPRTPR